jgi:hypothetical protein
MTLVHVGLALLGLGALGELWIYARGAWPTSLTWVAMGAGLLLTAMGLVRARSSWRYVAFAALAVFGLAVAVALLLG